MKISFVRSRKLNALIICKTLNHRTKEVPMESILLNVGDDLMSSHTISRLIYLSKEKPPPPPCKRKGCIVI